MLWAKKYPDAEGWVHRGVCGLSPLVWRMGVSGRLKGVPCSRENPLGAGEWGDAVLPGRRAGSVSAPGR